jgi:hypothetical protein
MDEILQVSYSAVLKHLYEDFHFQSFHLRWIPDLLTPKLREQRRGYASEMIPILTAADQDGWHHCCRWGRVLVLLYYSPRQMWTITRDDITTKLKHDIHMKNSCLSILMMVDRTISQ